MHSSETTLLSIYPIEMHMLPLFEKLMLVLVLSSVWQESTPIRQTQLVYP
jgi:hypothetical protein